MVTVRATDKMGDLHTANPPLRISELINVRHRTSRADEEIQRLAAVGAMAALTTVVGACSSA
jgi:hypothetical protein